jgi:response regulator of citrate/malate metabolism
MHEICCSQFVSVVEIPHMKKIESVLLIDDDPICNFLHSNLLKKHNITDHIQISPNGHEAFIYIDAESKLRNCPQLIFLDLNMPVMNGFEFLEAYSDGVFCERKPVIIILTTSSDHLDLAKLEKHSMVNGYLNKPLTIEKINTVLQTYFPEVS